MKKIVLFTLFMSLFANVVIAQTRAEKKQLKEEKAAKEYEVMKTIINSKMYIFDSSWISTSRGRRINISAGSNTLEVVQDSAKAAMQFFGEVSSIRFSGGEGVEFNNVMDSYEVKFDDKKRKITVSFNVKNKSEYYNIFMTINKSGYTYVDVFSNNKSNVTYDGNVEKIKED